MKIHGLTKTATHQVWTDMKQRCQNKKDTGYKYYGGRGIKVCKRWQDFQNFLADMGVRPEGLFLERVDNNKGYFPNNCVWADRRTQNRNRRSSIFIKNEDGRSEWILDWCERKCIPIKLIADRVHGQGMTYQDAIEKPYIKKPRKLNGTKVKYIKKLLKEGAVQTDIARQLGVHQSLVSLIKNKKIHNV